MSLKWLSFLRSTNQEPDSPHSWYNLFLIALFVNLTAGPRTFYGSLFVSIMDNFDMTREEATRTFNYYVIPQSLAGIFLGFLTFELGTKKTLYLSIFFNILSTFSESMIPVTKDYLFYLHVAFVFHGFFMGLPFAMMLQLTGFHFRVHRSKTMTMTCMFSAMSTITHPPLLIYILNSYGLRGYWLIHSTMLVQSLIPLVLITVPKRKTNRNELNVIEEKQRDNETSLNLLDNQDDLHARSKVRAKSISDRDNDDEINSEPMSARNYEQKSFLAGYQDDLKIRSKVEARSTRQEELDVLYLKPRVKVQPKIEDPVSSEPNQDEFSSETSNNNQKLNVTSAILNVKQGRPNFLPALLSLLKDLNFYAQILCQVVGGGGQAIIMATIVDFGMDDGLNFNEASYLFMTFGLGGVLSCILGGWFLDQNFLNDKLFMALGMFVSGSFIFVISFSSGWWIFAMTFGAGFAHGITGNTRIKLVTAIGMETTSTILGFGYFASSCLYLALPAAIGLCRDQYGSYFYLYLPLSLVTFSMTFLYLVIYWHDKKCF